MPIIIDNIKKGGGRNVFEDMARLIERRRLRGDSRGYNIMRRNILNLERRLQDFSDLDLARIQYEQASLFVSSCLSLLRTFYSLLDQTMAIKKRKKINARVTEIIKLLSKRSEYLLESLDFNIDNQVAYFEENVEPLLKKLHTIYDGDKKYEKLPYKKINKINYWNPFFDEKEMDDIVVEEVSESDLNKAQVIYASSTENKDKKEEEKNKSFEESEETHYEMEVSLWIDTDDAAEANQFMFIVTNFFASFENVKTKLKEVKKGSLYQKVITNIKGWFAKEEVIQVINKAQKAAEAKYLDKEIIDLESKELDLASKKKDESRKLSTKQAEKKNEIELQMLEERLKQQKIQTNLQNLEFHQKLSEFLNSGLDSIDSDYRIEINGMLVREQSNGCLKLGNTSMLDGKLKKSNPKKDQKGEELESEK